MHWTYSQQRPAPDLQQGDLLAPTTELQAILNEINPNYCADKYIGFVVTTQTCDLVRRKNKPPKAQYINIAVVRSLNESTTRFFETVAIPVGKGIFRISDQGIVRKFLHRLFNQNEQAHGLFYFHPDADIKLGDPSVAFLRNTITIKAEHYRVLLDARNGSLNPEFQAKFGWLVGNLYSRTATSDWYDKKGGEDELERLKKIYLQEQISGHGPIWLEDVLVTEGKKKGVEFDKYEGEELKEELEKYRPPTSIEILATEVIKEAHKTLIPHQKLLIENCEAFKETKEEIIDLLREKISSGSEGASDTELDDIRDEIEKAMYILQETSIDILTVNETKIGTLSNRLRNNGKIKKIIK